MELLQTYAPDVWLLYNEELERFKGQLDKELEALRKEADMVRARSGGACWWVCCLSTEGGIAAHTHRPRDISSRSSFLSNPHQFYH